MRDINQLLQVNQNPLNNQGSADLQNAQKEIIRKATAEATNSLFKDLCVIFPSFIPTLRKSSPEKAQELYSQTKKMWLDEITEEKLTPMMIELGLAKCRKSITGFMPSVGEFIHWCKPTEQDLGIPEVMDAYKMACNHTRGMAAKDYIHEIVFETGKSVGFFELSGTSEQIMLPKFKKQYDYFKSILMRGEKICETPIAIEYEVEPKSIDNRTPAQKRADMIKAKEQAMERML